MKRPGIAVIALAFAAHGAFGDPPEIAPNAESPPSMVVEGIQLQFHENGPTFGEERLPRFRVRAARGKSAGPSGPYTLEETEAIIHREGETDVVLNAAHCFFDQEKNFAVLSEGVRLTTGEIAVAVNDLRYDNDSGIARSDAEASMMAGENSMTGTSLLIDTRKDRVELTEGSGTIRMAAAQDAAGATSENSDSESRYESLDLDFEGIMRFNLNGQLDEVNQDVVLTMTGIDPADNLKVTAQKVTFKYLTKNDKKPAIVYLTGDVHLEHVAGNGRADTVTVNFATGDVEFRGNAELSSEAFEGARASVITINLYTKNAVLGPGGRIERVKLNDDAAKSADSPEPPRQ